MVDASNLVKGMPHAQHSHIGAMGTCPTNADDANGDGFVSTTEGSEEYGAIGTSLTTTGDTSPDSGLTVDRFPTSDDGTLASAPSRSPTTSTRPSRQAHCERWPPKPRWSGSWESNPHSQLGRLEILVAPSEPRRPIGRYGRLTCPQPVVMPRRTMHVVGKRCAWWCRAGQRCPGWRCHER